MKFFEIIIPVITAIIGMLGGLWGSKLYKSSKTKKRENSFKILNEIDHLKLDNGIKQMIIEEYEKQVLFEVKGLNITPRNYEIIEGSRIQDKFTDSQIIIANRFFTYLDKKIDIKIPWNDKLLSILFFILSIIFIVLSFGLFMDNINETHNLLRYFLILGFSLLIMISCFYAISRYVAPVNVANMIKRELQKINKNNAA